VISRSDRHRSGLAAETPETSTAGGERVERFEDMRQQIEGHPQTGRELGREIGHGPEHEVGRETWRAT